MGCNNSRSIVADRENSLFFETLVAEGNVFARALNQSWLDFMSENECRMIGDHLEANHVHLMRKVVVNINDSLEEATHQGLTCASVKQVAIAFLDFVVFSLSDKNWGGSIRHELEGSPGKATVMRIWGCATYTDHAGTHMTSPYAVEYQFYLCR